MGSFKFLKMRNSFVEKLEANIAKARLFDKVVVFTIASTSKKEQEPYLLPLRAFDNFTVTGCVLFDTSDLLQIIKVIDGLPDIIFVDSEFNYKKEEDDISASVNSINKQYETLFTISTRHLLKSQLLEFKPSDITVNAAWSFLSQKLGSVSGKKISIIGAGNIGSKLALKLAESGGIVIINRLSSETGITIARGLNNIKSSLTQNDVKYVKDKRKALLDAEVVVGTSNGVQVINSDMLALVQKDCLFVDLGKNNFSSDAIKQIVGTKKEFYRTDITAALEGMITEALSTRKMVMVSTGRRKLSFCSIISGGIFGTVDEIVVDDISDPKIIYGVSQGDGTLKSELSEADSAAIQKLQKYIASV